jgi:hypothetical protein
VGFLNFWFTTHKFVYYQDVDQATDKLPTTLSIRVLYQNRKEPDDVILWCMLLCMLHHQQHNEDNRRSLTHNYGGVPVYLHDW